MLDDFGREVYEAIDAALKAAGEKRHADAAKAYEAAGGVVPRHGGPLFRHPDLREGMHKGRAVDIRACSGK